ncbi:hypothetical protein FACS1894199_10470 [Bacteroidia bacterium]|nr:hypothetical protein FACS1894199_10470 [Bacteroidia bacterium]
MLDYNLVENLLTPTPDDAMAQVVNVRSYGEDEIATLMLKRGTLLTKVKDIVSGSVNEHLIAGGVIQLRGSRLKFMEEGYVNGIFLIPVADAPEMRLSVVVENKPARLISLLPSNLVAGEYHLEVRSTFVHGGKPSQTLKVGRFGKTLTAA